MRAFTCPHTELEFETMSLVHDLLVSPMLSLMAGHMDGIKSQLDLVHVVEALLAAFASTESAVREMVQGKRLLTPLFARQAGHGSWMWVPASAQCIVSDYLGPTDQAKLRRLWHGTTTFWMRRQWLQLSTTEQKQKEDALVAMLLAVFPRMAAKLRDRQPELCPGGEIANLDAKTQERFSIVPITTDPLEGDFGIGTFFITTCASMTMATTSTYVKALRNKMFHWLFSLPEDVRHRYIKLARLLARKREEDLKARQAQLQAARIARAKAQSEGAKATKIKKSAQFDKALATV